MLDVAIHGIEVLVIPFISDRQKGILAVVQDVFLGKIHGHCAHHLKGNVKSGYGKASKDFSGFMCMPTAKGGKISKHLNSHYLLHFSILLFCYSLCFCCLTPMAMIQI